MPKILFNLGFVLSVFLVSFQYAASTADLYELGPDSLQRHPGVPEGKVVRFDFHQSEVFQGTTRACWLYIPAQYDGSKPAALMVFQDGHAYVGERGQMRVPIVFDNLIARGDMPITIGLFINPGHRGGDGPDANGWGSRNNRSFEYDTPSGDYARFLIDELIPYITTKWDLNLTDNPEMRAICGMSSGGICAWTAAWERPDYFQKVLSHIGSFVNIRGGYIYPAIMRKTDRKPIRVFLQDGSNDLNNDHGNWPLANIQMARSLAYVGYDFHFVFGDGGHNGNHGGAILPESLKWLWKPAVEEDPKTIVDKVQIENPDWELVGEGYQFTDAACAHSNGDFYFSDLPSGTIYRVPTSTAKPEIWLEKGPKVSGMKFGPDGHLYAAVQGFLDQDRNNRKSIVRIHSETRSITEIANNVNPNDLVVTDSGWIYFTDTGAGAVVHVPITARGLSRPAPVARGIARPNGIALSQDGKRLIVSEYGGQHAWTFDLGEDGYVSGGEKDRLLFKPEDRADTGGDGMTMDIKGRTWITSAAGIQVFDAEGKLHQILARPQDKGTVSCALAGRHFEYLYVCSSDKIFRLKL